jgi:hypothetical protein
MNRRRLNALVWFGVLGGALTWAAQFVFGMQLGLARCESPNARFQLPVDSWAIGLAVAAVVVALLAEIAAIGAFRATREAKDEISAQRIHFLATVGMTINPLVLAIAVMSGIGVPVLTLCQQS